MRSRPARRLIDAVFAQRDDATAAVEDLQQAEIASHGLLRKVRSHDRAYDWEADAVLVRSIRRGTLIGLPLTAAVAALMVVLDVGSNAATLAEIAAGGLPGVLAGLFAGGLAGVLAGAWGADAERRWDAYPVPRGSLLVVVFDPDGRARGILAGHHGQIVESPTDQPLVTAA